MREAALRRILRIVLIGRREGLRARIRRRLGLFTWLDREARDEREAGHATAKTEAAKAAPKLSAPAGFEVALAVDVLQPGEVTEVVIGGETVALCNVDGEFFALDNTCPHAGGPLGDGTVDGHTLTCPYHGWSYDVRDGKCFVNADVVLDRYEVVVHDGAVCVRV